MTIDFNLVSYQAFNQHGNKENLSIKKAWKQNQGDGFLFDFKKIKNN